ncbi:MAG: hypothetical protein H0V22_10025 [Solirubrobacterales bacterium]|nr:hypothetical protein [Solirubrobacterales bacterium]
MTSLAVIGVTAIYLLFVWLFSAIAASWLSDRKGYGEKVGLATGLVLSLAGVVVWLVVPPRAASLWKTEGVLPPRSRRVETSPAASGAEASDET